MSFVTRVITPQYMNMFIEFIPLSLACICSCTPKCTQTKFGVYVSDMHMYECQLSCTHLVCQAKLHNQELYHTRHSCNILQQAYSVYVCVSQCVCMYIIMCVVFVCVRVCVYVVLCCVLTPEAIGNCIFT